MPNKYQNKEEYRKQHAAEVDNKNFQHTNKLNLRLLKDRTAALKYLHISSTQGKFKNETKTFIKEFNRVVKLLQK